MNPQRTMGAGQRFEDIRHFARLSQRVDDGAQGPHEPHSLSADILAEEGLQVRIPFEQLFVEQGRLGEQLFRPGHGKGFFDEFDFLIRKIYGHGPASFSTTCCPCPGTGPEHGRDYRFSLPAFSCECPAM